MNNRNSAAGWLVVLLRDSEIDMNKKTKKKKKLCGRIWECAIYLFYTYFEMARRELFFRGL